MYSIITILSFLLIILEFYIVLRIFTYFQWTIRDIWSRYIIWQKWDFPFSENKSLIQCIREEVWTNKPIFEKILKRRRKPEHKWRQENYCQILKSEHLIFLSLFSLIWFCNLFVAAFLPNPILNLTPFLWILWWNAIMTIFSIEISNLDFIYLKNRIFFWQKPRKGEEIKPITSGLLRFDILRPVLGQRIWTSWGQMLTTLIFAFCVGFGILWVWGFMFTNWNVHPTYEPWSFNFYDYGFFKFYDLWLWGPYSTTIYSGIASSFFILKGQNNEDILANIPPSSILIDILFKLFLPIICYQFIKFLIIRNKTWIVPIFGWRWNKLAWFQDFRFLNILPPQRSKNEARRVVEPQTIDLEWMWGNMNLVLVTRKVVFLDIFHSWLTRTLRRQKKYEDDLEEEYCGAFHQEYYANIEGLTFETIETLDPLSLITFIWFWDPLLRVYAIERRYIPNGFREDLWHEHRHKVRTILLPLIKLGYINISLMDGSWYEYEFNEDAFFYNESTRLNRYTGNEYLAYGSEITYDKDGDLKVPLPPEFFEKFGGDVLAHLIFCLRSQIGLILIGSIICNCFLARS